MKKKKKNLMPVLVIAICVPVIIIVSLIFAGSSIGNKVNTNEGESYLEALANLDVQQVEQVVRNKGEVVEPVNPETTPGSDDTKPTEPEPETTKEDIHQDSDFISSNLECYVPYYVDSDKASQAADNVANGSLSLKEIFDNTLFVGDSVITGFSDFQLVNQGNVIAEVGVALSNHLKANIPTIVNYNPEYLIIRYGLNEMDLDDGVLDAFITRYTDCIKTLQASLPYTKIIIVGLSPVKQVAVDKQPRLGRVSAYNTKIRKMCVELGVGYEEDSALFIAHPELYGVDGIHFQKSLYLLWMNDFIREMGIY